MPSSPIRVALLLSLAALVALPSLALAGASAASPGAHAAKRSKVPRVGTTLTSADQRLRLTVVAGRSAKGRKTKFVAVEWDLTATCSSGPAGVHLRARAAIRGNAFNSTVNKAGVKQTFTGRFVSAHKATGKGQLSFPTPGGDTCSTGVQRFTAQG